MIKPIYTNRGNVLRLIASEQRYTGLSADAVSFIEREQLSDAFLWKRFVDQFREQIDGNNSGWRGEYWGKMMRGAVTVYAYSQNESLYRVLTETVRDMLTVIESDGRVSSFSRETEFDAWDLWCRKYVMLGMEYYLEICRDEALKSEIVSFLCRLADYILAHIGNEEGKKQITKASRSWYGINSSSILEPMVWLYRLTNEKRYFDFATYIVELGAADGINIFELAYENRLYPYQYGVSKAYEMISCFEGLLEYYRVTGIEKYKIAAINFGKAVIESDVSVIGSCGCTHELFDHTKTRQTVYYEDVMQETCVTVTWMKYCARLLRLTGERIFADQIEQSYYNAYLGTLNTEHSECDNLRAYFLKRRGEPHIEYTFLPFDSYSPLTPDRRGKKVGGAQMLSDHRYYGCCACIAAAGVGEFLAHAVMADEEGLVICFYENGELRTELAGVGVAVSIETTYPANGRIVMKITPDRPVTAALKLRLPDWSKKSTVTSAIPHTVSNGYAVLRGEWSGTQTVVLELDMRIRETRPIHWESDEIYTDMSRQQQGFHVALAQTVQHKPEEDAYLSLARGPLTLAVDSRMGKEASSIFAFARGDDGEILCEEREAREIIAGVPCVMRCGFTAPDGSQFDLIDYASAGRDWKTEIAAWLPIEL
ncbi:MAG: hypothetical protein E7666_04530 [Ruminococcaceae bacterium]|nr:hypothetical protein [Oscillospiraceae bacterium]